MKVIQSYLQGARHKIKKQPCEDRTYSLSENGVTVIALADGAGSKKYTHSAQGAECVTKTIAKFFCNNFDKFYEKEDTNGLCSVIMAVCQRALKARADEIDVDDIIKMSSTLLVVAVKDNKMIACHIGDGVIGRLTSKGTEVISAPDNGEFISTTYFITNPRADEHIHIIKDKTDNVISYFLMSDGTQEYLYDEVNKCFYDAARKMALFPYNSNGQEKLEQSIKEYIVDADSSSDDCSFICMLIADENLQTKNYSTQKNEVLVSEENCKEKQNSINFNYNCVNSVIKNMTSNEDSCNKKRSMKTMIFIIILSIIIISSAIISINFGIKKNKNQISSATTSTTVKETTEETLQNEQNNLKNILETEEITKNAK